MTHTVVSLTPAVFHLPDAVNRVSAEYGKAPIVPRGPAFAPLLAKAREGICAALGATDYEAILLTGSGSTSMAAVLGSCLTPHERLMVIRNGAYGDRILEFARTLAQPVLDIDSPYGERPDLARIEAHCQKDEADAIAVVYGGTSTCTLNPVPEIGAIARKYGKKLLIDGISALFVEPMDLAGWGVTAVMGSCNKGLHGHPNLTVALVRRDLLTAMEKMPPRVPSLELYKTWRMQTAGAHPYTIDPLSICQVNAALDHLASIGGVPGRHALYQQRCTLLRDGYERLGLTIARWEGQPLQSIGTALHIPKNTTYSKMAESLSSTPVEGHTFEIYSAQGKLSDRLFRIFHMGEYPIESYEIFLRALAKVV
ncbi:MAG: aminotransferase class V-fold PLP-dependent enzyme [Polyangiaceae bacterium]